jgi:hypothetical protein
MKTTIITTLLAVGMLLRPQPVPVANNGVIPDNPVAISATQQAASQVLTTAEMNTAVGSGVTGCFQQIDVNGDVYDTCCIDLWIFVVCVSVNVSAIERLIPFL